MGLMRVKRKNGLVSGGDADGSITVFHGKGEIPFLMGCAHAVALRLRHATFPDQAFRSTTDQAESCAHGCAIGHIRAITSGFKQFTLPWGYVPESDWWSSDMIHGATLPPGNRRCIGKTIT